jgi:hypothetical protein
LLDNPHSQEARPLSAQTIIFWIIFDPITFGLGSVGAYVLFQEFTSLDHQPSFSEILFLLKKRWLPCLGLVIAVAYFFYRLFSVLNGKP